MAYAKCQHCKKQLNPKEAFKVVVSGRNQYWCNEECYKITESMKSQKVRTAKCQVCGTRINITDAFKVKKNGLNKYYCSEQEWQTEEDRKKKAKEDKDKVYYLICDMFGYEIQNTQLYDEWRCWNKLKSNEIIYKYLRENEERLQQVCDRSYDTEYQRIRYFSAILKNSLRDFKPKIEVIETPRVIENNSFELFEPSITPTQTDNVILEDVEDDLI